MGQAARAIIVQDDQLLVMRRNKHGSEYYTLVGGRLKAGEQPEQALVREIQEETGLVVTGAKLVFYEEHPEPYNSQYIFLCQIVPHGEIAVTAGSEEAEMNKLDMDVHQPMWVNIGSLGRLPFRTPALQEALIEALERGFPDEPIKLSP